MSMSFVSALPLRYAIALTMFERASHLRIETYTPFFAQMSATLPITSSVLGESVTLLMSLSHLACSSVLMAISGGTVTLLLPVWVWISLQSALDEMFSGSMMVSVTWSLTSERLSTDSGFWSPVMMMDVFALSWMAIWRLFLLCSSPGVKLSKIIRLKSLMFSGSCFCFLSIFRIFASLNALAIRRIISELPQPGRP